MIAIAQGNTDFFGVGSIDEDAFHVFRELGRTDEALRITDQAERAKLYDKAIRHSSLNYRIEARVRLDPAPEVVFETLLEMVTGQTKVEEAKGV